MLFNKYLSILFLFLISIFINIKVYYLIKESKYVQKVEVVEIIEKNETKKQQQEVFLTKEYLGYIEIKKINLKKLIAFGTTNYVLNKNVVGLHNAGVGLDEIGNTILAGHNNSSVFKNLSKLKVSDEIVIVSHSKCYRYKVSNINIYSKDDYSYYKSIDDKKILTLITCCNNNNYRLVITSVLFN